MKKQINEKTIMLILLIVLIRLLAINNSFIEKYYSNTFFDFLSKTERLLFGKIPFSIGDVLYFLSAIFLIYWVYKNFKILRSNIKLSLLIFLNFFLSIYMIFILFWGMNNYRTPLSEKMNLSTYYDKRDLLIFTDYLVRKTNEIQFEITKNKSEKVVNSYSDTELIAESIKSYEKLSAQLSFFEYQTTSIKKSLYSLPLSYMGFSGYLNPLTNEAQYNYLIPSYSKNLTIAHEMAHQIGYASESECNFIGYLATTQSENLYVQYSGYSFALKYCLSNLKRSKAAEYDYYISCLNVGVLKNFEESKQFWENYSSPISDFFETFYDQFLKINNQKEGIDEYAKFLNLLINYEKKQQNPSIL